ncbi:MAG: CoA ester lyase [Alphaproteobacteria bacterium]|nr:CoA ester lyase [Alphaproteobacteria bacterium]
MTMHADLPVWRSMLFVPVTRPRFVEKGADAGADAIILDFEDSVAPADKERARTLLPEAAKQVSRKGADVVVRVNRPWRLLVRDLEAAVIPGIAALALPKIESAEHVQAIAEIVDELETERGIAPGTVKLQALIETASGFFRIEQIARAHPRLNAVSIGAEDLALSVGMVPEAEGLFYPKQQCIIAARAAGILPLGFLGTVADYKDLDAFRATIRRSRRLGFLGASCIHPSNVPILNEEFAPTAEEVSHAERMVAAYDEALAAGRGSIEFEGKMIDIPVVERAKQVLARANAIRARAG